MIKPLKPLALQAAFSCLNLGGIKLDFLALRYAAVNAAHTLYQGFSYKSIMAAILAVLLHKHAVLFLAFTALVFLDCFTRWMSLSYKRLQNTGLLQPSVMQIIVDIKAARSEGLISSEVMKHRFVGKVVVYILCVLAAVLVDVAMLALQQQMQEQSSLLQNANQSLAALEKEYNLKIKRIKLQRNIAYVMVGCALYAVVKN